MPDIKKHSQFKNMSPQDQRLMNRLVHDQRNPSSSDGMAQINTSAVTSVLRKSVREGTDIKNLFKVLPWLHLPREILISSITSPGDMIQVKLSFSNNLKGVDTALTAMCDRVIRDFFVHEKKMEEKIYDWVDEGMVSPGAHPIMILPEAVVDKMIHGMDTSSSMESLNKYGDEYLDDWFKPKGMLGVPLKTSKGVQYASLESVRPEMGRSLKDLHTIRGTLTSARKTTEIRLPIHITDNLMVFRKPAVDKIRRDRGLAEAYGVPSLEAARRKNGHQQSNASIRNQFFKSPRRAQDSRIQVVPTVSKEEIAQSGHPLEYHLPAESVIPIHVPGDEAVHTHYLVALDGGGYPLSRIAKSDYYDSMRQHLSNNGSETQAAGDVIEMARVAMGGNVSEVTLDQLDRLARMHASVVESDIIDRLRAGLGGEEVTFNIPDQVNRMMLARAMSNQYTTLVLVPADYVIYITYEYNEYGVGQSILDDAKGLAAMVAAVQVANVLGAVQNAIPGKDINIELDPEDRTPQETATFMIHEAIGLAYRQFPSTVGSTAGMAEQLQMSSFNVNVSGNPRYPEVKTSVTQRESSMMQVDTELETKLGEDLSKVFGVTSEMLGGMNQPEFATTALNNSLLLLKRVMAGQKKTNPFLTDYVRIFTYHSGTLINRLLETIKEYNKKIDGYDDPAEFVYDYISSLWVALPEPQVENLEKQVELVEKMDRAVTAALPAYLKEEYFAGFSDDVIEKAFPVVFESFKGLIMRNFMRKHGILRDMDIFGASDDGSPLVDMFSEAGNHSKILLKSLGKYPAKVAEWVKKNGKDFRTNREKIAEGLTAMEEGDEPEVPDDFGLSDPPSDTPAPGEEGSDVGNEDDLSLSDDDLGMVEPPEDIPPPE